MKKVLLFIFFGTVLFGFGNAKFLMPNEAFVPHANVNKNAQVVVDIDLADGIYLYKDKIKIDTKKTSYIKIKDIKYPKATIHDGDMVYMHSVSFVVSLKTDESITKTKKFELKLSYQGCSTAGLCYEPVEKEYVFDIDISKLQQNTDKKIELSKTDAIAQSIKNGSLVFVIFTFLGFGLLLSLTPCVFPMIPIISGVIISQGKGITTTKAFVLSLVYVLSMAVAYTIAGVLAGLFGANLQAALQNPWVIYAFSGVFVALALSMFGFYELKLPDSLVTKVSSNQNRGGYVGVAVMGFLSALIVGPCVAAPLAGALVYIGQSGDALLGGIALFSMSIGMGIPLIAVGVSAGKFMPKPGVWMSMVSAVFGVMMLGVAIWMLQRVLPWHIIMLLYGSLGMGFCIYLGVFQEGGHIFKKMVSVVLFVYSLAVFVGGLGGSKSLVQPLEFLKPQPVQNLSSKTHTNMIKVSTVAQLQKVLKENRGKKIMLDFYASWCTSCKELKEVTFADSRVQKRLEDFVVVGADLSKNGDEQKELSKKYGVFGPPVIIFFDKDTNILKSKTIVGFVSADEFLQRVEGI